MKTLMIFYTDVAKSFVQRSYIKYKFYGYREQFFRRGKTMSLKNISDHRNFESEHFEYIGNLGYITIRNSFILIVLNIKTVIN